MTLTCPIAGYRIDERAARLSAGFVVLLTIFAWSAPAYAGLMVFAFLACDFGVRAFSRPRWSVLGAASRWLLAKMEIAPRWVDAGPKRFAARIGMSFSLTFLVAGAFGWSGLQSAVILVLGGCAGLEAGLGLCLGCWMWTGWYELRARLPIGSLLRQAG